MLPDNIFAILIPILIPLVSAIIKVPKRCKEKRIEMMKNALHESKKSRNCSMQEALKMHKEMLCRLGNDVDMASNLICETGWVNVHKKNGCCTEIDVNFFQLKEIDATIIEAIPDSALKSKKSWKTLPNLGKEASYFDTMNEYIRREEKKRDMWDGPLYALGNVCKPSELDDKFSLCVYYKEHGYKDFYDTCEYLVYEVAYAKSKEKKKRVGVTPCTLERYLPYLPARKACINVFDFTNRFVGIGVNAMIIVKGLPSKTNGESNPMFFLHVRSEEEGEAPNTNSVLPAGSWQPTSDYNENENQPQSLEYTFFREFKEEILGRMEMENPATEAIIINQLDGILKPYFLGIGLEPLNLKAEILVVAIMDFKEKESWPEIREINFKKINTIEELEEQIKNNANYETEEFFLKELSQKTLAEYEKNKDSTAALREIARIVNLQENRGIFGVVN